MKKFLIFCLFFNALITAEEEFDSYNTYYSYDASYPFAEYVIPDSECYIEKEPCARQLSQQECYGSCYYNCRSAGCYIAGVILGTAAIAGIAAIIIHDSSCAHSH